MVDPVLPEIPNDDVMIRYLLGELSEQERTRIEENYFLDPGVFEHLCAVEDELIDAYVRGELGGAQREHFEQLFLASPQRRTRVEFARSLLERLSRQPAATTKEAARSRIVTWWESAGVISRLPKPALLWPLAAVALALVIVVGWRLAHKETMPRIQVQERTPLKPPPTQAQQQPMPSPTPPPRPAPKIATFLLTPVLTRDLGGAKTFMIPSGVDWVQFRLDPEAADYKSYRAVLRTPEGREIWSGRDLTPQASTSGKSIFLKLPASTLTSGDYILTLSGLNAEGKFEDVNDYSFRLAKR